MKKKIKILTIDDESAIRQSIKAYLEDYEYQVLEAENGRIGIEMIKKRRPDLILVDLRMPEIDGLDVLKITTKNFPDIPIIVVSGTGVITDAIDALHLGAWDYILKPIQDMSILLHSVEKCLERSVLINENRCHQEHLEEKVTVRTKELKKSNKLLKSEINAHKDTLDALQYSERKLDSIIMTVPDIIYRLDRKGHISFISHSVKKYGYSPEDLIGKNIINLVHPDDRQIAQNHLNERRTGSRKTTSLEIRLLSHNKKSRPFEISSKGVDMDPVFLIEAEGLYDVPGRNKTKFLGTQGIARDVTARKRAEHALVVSEERLDLAIQGAGLGLWDWDLQNNQIVYNIQWAQSLGLSTKKLSTKSASMEKLIHADDLPLYHDLMEKHLNKTSPMFEAELRFLSKEKKWKWILLRGKVVGRDKNDKPLRFTGTQLDITRRKEAETSSQLLAAAIEQATDSIILFDASLNIRYANPAFKNQTGYSDKDVINHSLQSLNLYETNNEKYSAMLEYVNKQQPWEGKLTQIKKNGEALLGEASISPIRDQKGMVSNYVLVQRDTSKEENLSEQLRQAQKMETVGRMAGSIAHDFNNILTVISGYCSLCISKTEPDHPLYKNIQQIQNVSHRAESLTRQLLAFSRKQVLQPKVINLNNTLKNLNKMLFRLIGKNIEFNTKYDNDLGQINADPSQMEQVVMNLIINARDAMPNGGDLTIRTQNITLSEIDQVEIHGVEPGKYILLTVSDSGTGMDETVIKQIFEPFFTTKDSGKGTGLGLSTVYGVVHQSGGFILVDSELKKGSVFKVYLPHVNRKVETEE